MVRKFLYSLLFFLFSTNAFCGGTQFTLESKAYKDPVVYIVILFAALVCFYVLWSNKINKKHIKDLAYEDELTGLPTQKKFKAEASYSIRHGEDNKYSMVSIDINKFRYINEVFGSNIGNSVLIEFSNHIKTMAPEGSICCRHYVDNFSILLPATLEPVIQDTVEKLTDIQKQISKLLPVHFQVKFNVGVYVISDNSESIDKIIEKANTARLIGKKSIAPNQITYFDDSMMSNTESEKDITFDMNRAFENKEFIVYYQPKFNFEDSTIAGAEALIRWNHKSKGLISPAKFVPLFEKNGFIAKIDTLVFENVCQFLERWNKNTAGKKVKPMIISCNLSRAQLCNPDVVKNYAEIASKYKIKNEQIEIELTESLMMENKDRLLKIMNDIKEAGFGISVDDFGSGFSSLSLLKDIPANVIKLDKEFLSKDSKKEHIIISSVINMAKDLNLKTVAEGVEDKEQSDFLKSLGCDIAQGFFFARPMPEKEFEELLNGTY